MSKTVKRVMTVMMIGLVALLGTKAEAHTRWVNGKPRVCSICGHGTLEEVPDPKDHPAVAELFVKTAEVRIKCNDGSTTTLIDPPDTATLVARTPSKDWVYNKATAQAEVEFFAPGESDELFAILEFCSVANPLVDAQILKMSARFEASECIDKKCLASVLLSTIELNGCEVELDAKPDTPYVCKETIIRHVHPSPRTK